MKNLKYIFKKRPSFKRLWIYLPVLFMSFFFVSCQDDEIELPAVVDNPLELTASSEVLILNAREASSTFTFSWTTSSNKGTGASIEYVLQIDKKGNNFSNAAISNMGKGVYLKSYTYSDLNNLLLNQWGFSPDKENTIEARIIAIVASIEVAPDTSDILECIITPYLPVTSELYIIGSATEAGWDIANAVALNPDNQDPTIFTFQGTLSKGTFKFPVNRNTDLMQDMYMRDPSISDSSKIYLHKGGDSDDNQWEITNPGTHIITVSLYDLTINIESLKVTSFDSLYIVGDASESGWDVDNPTPFTKSEADPFVFYYEGMLTPGELKILAGTTGDWCGEWYRATEPAQPITEAQVVQNSGCDEAIDHKWVVTDETQGYYRITLNTKEVTISFEKINIYLIGDAGPNGWNIASPDSMVTNNTGIYTYTGPLTAGEFKFSTFKGDWCESFWIHAASADQDVTNGDYIVQFGCNDDTDYKWRVTDETAGNYSITINLVEELITIIQD